MTGVNTVIWCLIVWFRIKNPVRFSYSINPSVMHQLITTTDLGVVFARKIYFNLHISGVIAKASPMLGLGGVKNSIHHNGTFNTWIFITSLVSLLFSKYIESIQKQFVCLVCSKLLA